MTDPLDEEPRRAPTWAALQESIHWWPVARFGVNRPLDKDIWLFCIAAAMHLERLAVAVLWVDDGHSEPLYEYAPRRWDWPTRRSTSAICSMKPRKPP